MKSRSKPGLGAAVKAALLFAALFAVVLAAGAESRADLRESVFLTEDLSGGAEVLLFQEQDGLVWLALSGQDSVSLMKLDGATGRVLASRQTEGYAGWAALRGNRLFLREDGDDGPQLVCRDADSLEELFRRDLEGRSQNFLFFTINYLNELLVVESQSRNTLRIREESGRERELSFSDPVEFLAADPSGTVYLYAGDTLFLDPGGENSQEYANLVRPAVLLGRGRWIDEEGVVCRLGEQGPEPLFRMEKPVYASNFYCLDRENCLILSENAGSLYRYEETGEPAGFLRAEPGVRGLCGAGILSEKRDGFYYTPLDFLVEPEPSPSPSFSPGPSPYPEENVPAWVEEDFLVAPAGTTAAQIRELLKPETADIRNAMGLQVTQGSMATGMTVNDWTVVILGDCDGSGTVSGADVRRAMSMALDGGLGGPAYRRAADLDCDGAVGGSDLVRLSAMVGGW